MLRHLDDVRSKRVQEVTRADLTAALTDMRRRGYSAATISHVHRLCKGTLALAEQDGLIVRSPAERLSKTVVPKYRAKKSIRRLDPSEIERLVAAGGSRWAVAIALAGYAALRLGEIRGLKWSDIDFEGNTLRVVRSLLPDGTVKATKTEAGVRTVPILPALARELVAWQARSPRTDPADYVVCTHDGKPIQERNLNRALKQAIAEAKITVADSQRLSWHSLRHSAGSFMVTQLAMPITKVARALGHTDPSFTLKVYARDASDEEAFVADMLQRAEAAGVGA
jgi:integrase